jgi:hypothetical protein
MSKEEGQMRDSEILRQALQVPGKPTEWTAVFEEALADVEACDHFNSIDPGNEGKTRVMVSAMTATAILAAQHLVKVHR